MGILRHSLRDFLKRSKTLVEIKNRLDWKLHILKDWFGTKVWTRTSEVVTPLGFKLISGFHPAYALMRKGTFEIEETELISQLLKEIDVFVDIGANLGYYTCIAVQQGATVVAFEPQEQNLRCLFANLIANRWENHVEIFPVALSDKPGLLTLYGASGPSASLVKNWAGYSSHFRKTVPVSTLDNVLAGRFASQSLLIKIDVEGAEYQVLKGATRLISREPRPIWLLEICFQEFHPSGLNPDFREIFQLFWDNGYVAYTATKEPTLVTPVDVERWLVNQQSDSGTFNYVFAHPSKRFAKQKEQ